MSKKRRSEYEHYQPNNPLTIYYKKYIEKEPEKKNIKVLLKKKAPKRLSSTNKRSINYLNLL